VTLPLVPGGESLLREGRLFHLAMMVPDLEQSMAFLSQTMGITWTAKREMRFPLIVDGREVIVNTRNAFSREGPAYLELISGADPLGTGLPGTDGTIFETGPSGRFHHAGIYVDDVKAETERLAALGMRPQGHVDALKHGRYYAAFLTNPQGFHLELIDIRAKRRIEENVAAGV
jgi:catechol 2,3-dioxygenase-like lactoylglutathione lyase family enzyme